MPDDAGDRTNRGDGSRWHRQVLVAVAVAVATSLAVVLIAPLSDALKELLNPTSAEISGLVRVGDRGLASATVRIDDGEAIRTDAEGKFEVDDVSDGEHQLRVSKLGVLTRVKEVRVRRGEREVDVGTIRVEPALRMLGHDRTVTENRAFKWIRHYDIALWIAPDRSIRDEIVGVRYDVPERLAVSPLKGEPSGRRFCAVVRRTLPMNQWLTGNFPITARVRLKNGRSLVVSNVEERIRRPRACG